MEIGTWSTQRCSGAPERGRYASCLRDDAAETTRPITMDKARERLARWMKDGSALLTQLLDDLNRTKTSLSDLERECASLREENTRFRKERSEVVEKIAASLDTVSDTLLRFRDGAAPVAAQATATPTVEPGESPVHPPSEPRDPHGSHIMVVDDDTSFRNMLAHHLSEHGGYEVTSAVNGEEALQLLTTH